MGKYGDIDRGPDMVLHLFGSVTYGSSVGDARMILFATPLQKKKKRGLDS